MGNEKGDNCHFCNGQILKFQQKHNKYLFEVIPTKNMIAKRELLSPSKEDKNRYACKIPRIPHYFIHVCPSCLRRILSREMENLEGNNNQ